MSEQLANIITIVASALVVVFLPVLAMVTHRLRRPTGFATRQWVLLATSMEVIAFNLLGSAIARLYQGPGYPALRYVADASLLFALVLLGLSAVGNNRQSS